MTKIHSREHIKILVICCILFLVGCSNPTALPTTVTSTIAALPTHTSPTPAQVLASSTPEETLSTPPTAISAPTWTPIPTLSSEMSQSALVNLYSNNGGCQIPCWWGITPGVTTWAQANEILAPMSLGIRQSTNGKNGITMYEITYRIPKGVDFPTLSKTEGDYYRNYFNPILFVQNETVLAIELNTGWISQGFESSLVSLLNMLGQPDEIWLRLITDEISNYGPRYDIRLFYGTKGVLLSSEGDATRQGEKLLVCPQVYWEDKFPPSVILWSPSLNITFEDFNDNLLGDMRNTYSDEYVLLESATEGFSVADFYEIYLEPGTASCFAAMP